MQYHSSVRRTSCPFGHPSLRKKFWPPVYNIFMVHGTRKKTSIGTLITEKNYVLVSGYSITMMHSYLKIWISLEHHREKYIFVSDYSATVIGTRHSSIVVGIDTRVHRKKNCSGLPSVVDVLGTCEKLASVLYTHQKRIVCSYNTTMEHWP